MIAVKIENNQVIDFQENVDVLPEGFTNLWEQGVWSTYQEVNRKVAVLLADTVVQQFVILPFSLSPTLPEGFTELWARDTWSDYVEAMQVPQLVDTDSTVKKCFEFGDKLKMLFVADNWRLPMPFTVEISLSLSAKFADIVALCGTGGIKEISQLLPSIPTDSFFTQERKDIYQSLINDFVAQNYPS